MCVVRAAASAAFRPRLKFLSRTSHTYLLFFVTHLRSSIMAKVMQVSMQQLDNSYTTTILHERNDLVLFILSVTHGGYNMFIRCNQKCMICKDRQPWYRFQCLFVQGILVWNVHAALWGIFTLPPTGRKKDTFQRSSHYRKPNFRCRRDKKIFTKGGDIVSIRYNQLFMFCKDSGINLRV